MYSLGHSIYLWMYIINTPSSNYKSYYTLLLKTGGFWLYFEECKENGNAFHFFTLGSILWWHIAELLSIEVNVKNLTYDTAAGLTELLIYFVWIDNVTYIWYSTYLTVGTKNLEMSVFIIPPPTPLPLEQNVMHCTGILAVTVCLA